MIVELARLDQVRSACGDDDLLMWTAQGLPGGVRLCRWVSGELVAARGRAALMVDDGNLAAIGVYERIGYRRRAVMASQVV